MKKILENRFQNKAGQNQNYDAEKKNKSMKPGLISKVIHAIYAIFFMYALYFIFTESTGGEAVGGVILFIFFIAGGVPLLVIDLNRYKKTKQEHTTTDRIFMKLGIIILGFVALFLLYIFGWFVLMTANAIR